MASLRDSGKIVGSPFSVRRAAGRCGLPFPLSLIEFMNTRGCPLPACIRLHIKVLTPPLLPIATMLDRMREVYGDLGVAVEVISRETLTPEDIGDTAFTDLNDLNVGRCVGGETSSEQDQLFENENHIRDGARDEEIVAYFVRSVLLNDTDTLNGCAAHPDGKPGVAVSQFPSQWTLAHEVGHVLGLNHISGENTNCPDSDPGCCDTPDFTRLMTGCGTDGITGTPGFSQSEINTITESALVNQC